ncbi:NADH-quinone oxidoreductase subunit 5 [Clostridium tepidiprofundi DSM 19306]|uniref:NADH-quinone oxidoreductase subunit 5 n=1 Tax=Clostridium tepidiprofundi DSM 19306 TaxID=1121338 RepID=A0A151B5S5_9CLOT|nr:NADH-quinone oxidoreductase subunit C [Clostridium tepidiprofundi]KYH35284.1 NADH-quinone oxidoreductase subunit 5 [Clostridium tepidiprofundi DSM 19306]
MLTIEELIKKLENRGLETYKICDGEIKVTVSKDELLNHLQYLQSIGFEHLANINGVDYIDENEFEVVYHTYSYTHKIHIINKVRIPREKPLISTVVGLWEQAQFYEQEVHEFFGIVFEGNKDLSGLFLENWRDLPPLRKDFDTEAFSEKLYGSKRNGGAK